ncbi:MAG: hypothetical protein A3F82_00245 [Deltaproteobacteria bacterium RIFCSPLOWO2_12_FULL_44_12]|nr:MAG: hypothetical protein A2712_04710 [Deltaproteobacteria bacterium RIFCSPHIGHO2_01_FULL_43_49]OGQ16481.1 MAG: hypothetical protein A3D22_02675 [Deltaproteobacteria bacterium RIFCSPHIGHO2_02_FULL_44_53]OGQ27691.1 MAG: hypothetical protein A3D98_08310 [Deltaproteobacteria bacterium RIFCSPHIGHO2_12_FULL_44_21]OGQ32999.1 MAG: hypothetical protein A2979_10605 [Deltaproteobacteria bacterium RIFCSPLOWO2_01_FULL_45_74]OGQ42100.1 MAG: hypothetical protein A3I70_10395 [Deltaproteobacteria bacterium 
MGLTTILLSPALQMAVGETARNLLAYDLATLKAFGNEAGLGLILGEASEVPGVDSNDLLQKAHAIVAAVREGRLNQASAIRADLVGEFRRLLASSRLFAAKPESLLPPLQDNGATQESNELEVTTISPKDFFSLVEKEFGRVRARYQKIEASLNPAVRGGYLAEMKSIEKRIEFWRSEIENLKIQHGKEKDQYREDIILGERILLDRVLNLGASVYSEPVEEKFLAGVGLRTQIAVPIPSPKIPRKRGEKGNILEALVNHDVGYGRALRLRPHQVLVLNKIKGLLKMREEQLKDSEKLPENLLVGTITMPTGGGKTRVMVASFAADIELGFFKLGDKFIILNHTEQIHEQNLKVVRLLSSYFKRRFGRRLRVTEYKAEDKNLRGDVVVVNIPSVNTLERRERFEKELRKALAEKGKLTMVAVDEIHHLEMATGKSKESWKEIIRTLRGISPNFYRIGFTATPTGNEGPYIARISEMALMQSGVTPRTYLAKVGGIDLSQLKISQYAKDFQTKELVSTLLDYPERNQRLFETLERNGLRRLDKSPSGKERLEAVLTFAADLRHAKMMANDYVHYFGQEGEGLRGRDLTILGEDRGRIRPGEFNKVLEAYHKGEVDGIVVIVSGETRKEIREQILTAVEKGEIEAVFNVDVWLEGADLYMFTHLLGSRPTFSRFKKAQERGRLNRRGPKEVSHKGELLSDKPKIIFDIVDRYQSVDRSLMLYGNLMGVVGHAHVKLGELFDAMSGQIVSEIDREGRKVEHKDLGELLATKRKVEKPAAEELQKPLVAKLWEILEDRYGGDVEMMAMDLGLPVEEMQEILQGKGWINTRWFLRRLATLLYQDREVFVDLYNEEQGLRDERVTEEDIAILKGALAVYEKWEGAITTTKIIKGNIGLGEMSAEITNSAYRSLYLGTLGDTAWRGLWRGLALYFGVRGQELGQRQRETKEWFQKLHGYLFEREGWQEEAKTAQGKFLLTAREGVALKFAGKVSTRTGLDGVFVQALGSPLIRWLSGKKISFGEHHNISPRDFYNQVRNLLLSFGKSAREVDQLILEAVFEQKKWKREALTPKEKLLLTARELMVLEFGGRLPKYPDIPGVPIKTLGKPLDRWINGEEIHYSGKLPPYRFYGQLRSLLVGLGKDVKEVDTLIQETVFEERKWEKEDKTAEGLLRLAARQGVALHFGGKLPTHTGIPGLTRQNEGVSLLSEWLKGKGMKMLVGGRVSPKKFYNQVKSLLVGLGKKREEVDFLVLNAVFEQEGWERTAETAQEKLLLAARELMALEFGGRFPGERMGIDGVSSQYAGRPLTRWLHGEKIIFKRGSIVAKSFYSQVKSLLLGLGRDRSEVDELIEAAIFEENGWERKDPSNARERLLLEARRSVTRNFGGKLPTLTNIKGISLQEKDTALTLWLNGKKVQHNYVLFTQIRALLIHEGFITPHEADRLIQEAQAETTKK